MPVGTQQLLRFSLFWKKLLGLRTSNFLDVVEQLVPVVDLLSFQPDVYVLRGDDLWGGTREGTAIAAQFPTAWFGVQGVANELMVIEQLLVQSATAQRVRVVSPGVAIPGAPTLLQNDDKRLTDIRFTGVGIFSSEAALLGTVDNIRWHFNLAANVPQLLQLKYVAVNRVAQDGSTVPRPLAIQGETAATDIIVSARGYGRSVTDKIEIVP